MLFISLKTHKKREGHNKIKVDLWPLDLHLERDYHECTIVHGFTENGHFH